MTERAKVFFLRAYTNRYKFLRAGVVEWLKASDCNSDDVSLRRFESYPLHHFLRYISKKNVKFQIFKSNPIRHDNAMTILTDIGGTHIRCARGSEGSTERIRKYKAADFENLQAALRRYCEEESIEPAGGLRIATAGYEDKGVWKFVNENKWIIDPEALKAEDWNIEVIINDFEAATHALKNLNAEDVKILKDATGASESKCLLGPGTGLGLGFLHGQYVQKTHGGHIPVASLNDEHGQTIKAIRASQNTDVVFENIVSGPGFFKLKELYAEETALRLFHEFLGIFAATAIITGHAYGGLYLTGGVLEKFMANGLFDFSAFEQAFHFNAVASVQDDLKATPIYCLTDPYPALKGLLNVS